jgi:hypothetical protein
MPRDIARPRLLVVLLLALSLLTVVVHRPAPAAAAGAHPRLLFSAADIPALRARAATGDGARAWATLKQRLDDYIDNPLDPVGPQADQALAPTGKSRQTNWHLDPARIGERGSDGTLTYYQNQNQLPAMLIDLAFGYVITGDTTYSNLVIASLKAVADAGWPYWDDQTRGKYLGAGDLMRGVALAFDWTYDAMSQADRDHIVQGLANPTSGKGLIADGDATNTKRPILDAGTATWGAASSSPGSNWAGVTAGGAGLLLLAVQGEAFAPADLTSRLSTAQSRVSTYLSTGFGLDGEGGEGHTYANYGLHGALPFAFALKRSGGADLIGSTPGMSHLVDYVASMLIPSDSYDGTVPLNDDVRDALGDELVEQLWEISPTSSLVSWLWEHTLGPAGVDRYDPLRSPPYLPGHNCVAPQTDPGVFVLGCGWSNAEELNIVYSRHATVGPAAPESALPTGLHFNDHGLVVGRTGWSAGVGEVLSTFNASRGNAGHTQEDIGQFTLYGYGGDFAIDSGYGHNYSCGAPVGGKVSPPVRPDRCDPSDDTIPAGQSVGHNLILVDDDARTQLHARTQLDRQTIPEFLTGAGLSFAHADTRSQFPIDPPLANRDWLFTHAPGQPVLLVIGDQLNRDGGQHNYNWQLHTNANNAVALHANGFTITSPSGAVLNGLTTRNGDLLQSTRSVFEDQPFEGSTFDRPVAHQLLLQLDYVKHEYHDELAVMALTPAGAVPAVVQRIDVPGGNGIEVTRGGVGTMIVKALTGVGSFGGSGVALTGALGYAVQGMGECLLRQGSRLFAYGVDYVTVTGGTATVANSGGQVQATGTAGASYKVYAPGAVTTVTVNGVAVPWTRSGDYITF